MKPDNQSNSTIFFQSKPLACSSAALYWHRKRAFRGMVAAGEIVPDKRHFLASVRFFNEHKPFLPLIAMRLLKNIPK